VAGSSKSPESVLRYVASKREQKLGMTHKSRQSKRLSIVKSIGARISICPLRRCRRARTFRTDPPKRPTDHDETNIY
jgi:hypothetical protein